MNVTDGQTDDMRLQDCTLHYSALCSKTSRHTQNQSTYRNAVRGGPINGHKQYVQKLVQFDRVVFTPWCTIVQSAVLRSHVVCPSVHPSVCQRLQWNTSLPWKWSVVGRMALGYAAARSVVWRMGIWSSWTSVLPLLPVNNVDHRSQRAYIEAICYAREEVCDIL